MPNIVDRFGQLVDGAIPKPELARQLLLLGYRAKDVQLLLAPEKELTPARQYAAQIAMDAMIAPLAHPQRAALVNIFMPCELLHAFHLLPMFAEATACYLNGASRARLCPLCRERRHQPHAVQLPQGFAGHGAFRHGGQAAVHCLHLHCLRCQQPDLPAAGAALRHPPLLSGRAL